MTPASPDEDDNHDPFTRREFLCLAGVGVAVLADPTGLLAREGGWTERAPVGPSSLAEGSGFTALGGADLRFAASVALAGDVALVGLPPAATVDGPSEGRAELFARSADGWARAGTLRPASIGGQFGRAVALGNDYAAVGAPLGSGPAGPHGGRVSVFTRRGGRWTPEATLTAPGAPGVDGFGATLAADGDRLLVGAPGTRSGREGPGGAAHLFRRTGRGWTREACFRPRDDTVEDAGRAVALEGETALVAARRPDARDASRAGDGVVHVYRRTDGRWTSECELVPADAAGDCRFGAAVAVTGATAVVGAPAASTQEGPRAGAVHVFTHRDGRWSREAVLRDERGRADGLFGAAVAAGRDAVLAADGASTGLVLLNRFGDGWRETARWPAPAFDPEVPGPDVALDRARALVAIGEGTDRGSSRVAALEA